MLLSENIKNGKMKALENAMHIIEKEHGKGSVMLLGIYSKKPPHFNEEMNCYLALYVQDVFLYFIDLTYLL